MAAYNLDDIAAIMAGRYGLADFIPCPFPACTTPSDPFFVFDNVRGTTAFGGRFYVRTSCQACSGSMSVRVTEPVRNAYRDAARDPIIPIFPEN